MPSGLAEGILFRKDLFPTPVLPGSGQTVHPTIAKDISARLAQAPVLHI